ncbi:MAG: enolase C-terminal domain-like protein [Planctomycetota bacterium]|jgi:L-rhamnonate dehydratase
MKRRAFFTTSAAVGLAGLARAGRAARPDDSARFPEPAPLSFRGEKSGLRITAIRAVELVPKRPLPEYQPAPGSWNTTDVEIANPLSVYPRFKPRRSLFYADDLGPNTVMVETDKGITGFGYGGPGAAFVVERHLPKLLVGEDPFQVERLWDIMWRGTLYYGRKGVAVNAIGAVDNALWDLVGKALGAPVYQLLGGGGRPRVPGYCTGNNIEQAVAFGFKKLKLAVPHGPADGEEGLEKNEQLVERARRLVGPKGEIMLDCWMGLTEAYAEKLAARLAPYRVYWIEECLMPDDYAGMGRLNARIQSTRMATGEHESTRWGFELLADYQAADVWQPDMHWCGGLTELRWIDALARANNVPVIPHAGWRGGAAHFVLANENTPWCEMFLPWPGGPKEVYERFEEEHQITRGSEGITMRPPNRPGFGFELKPA